MKRTFFFISILMISGLVHAQSSLDNSVPEPLEFVPKTVVTQPGENFTFENQFTDFKPNKLLITSGWILRGLKYDSAIDEFQSYVPFDERAFTPNSFSELNSSLTNNYLIIHKH